MYEHSDRTGALRFRQGTFIGFTGTKFEIPALSYIGVRKTKSLEKVNGPNSKRTLPQLWLIDAFAAAGTTVIGDR